MALIFTKLTSKLLDDAKESVQYVDEIRMRAARRATIPKDTPIRFQIRSEVIVEMASKNALPQPVFASPETVTALVSGALKEQWDTWIKSFNDNVVSDIFLAKGEESISERFTYLESSFLGHPEGTAAFIRQTNYCEYCYLVPGHIVLASKTKDASCKDLLRVEEPKMQNYGVVRKTSVKQIGGFLADGVLNGFLGTIGVLIFNAIFPSDMTDFFDAMYKEIEKIVDEALTEEAIAELNGKILGTEQWVRNTYTALKEGTYTPKMLTEKLQPVEEDFARNVIGVLQEDRFSKPGICTFLIGAGMHLAILQELLFVDFTVTDLQKSPYFQAIKNWAKEYGDYVYRTVDDILETRNNMIQMYTSNLQTNNFTFVLSAWWKDDYDNTQSKQWTYVISSIGGDSGDENYTDHCRADMEKHQSAVRKDWIERMGDPYVVADTWYKLVDTGGI